MKDKYMNIDIARTLSCKSSHPYDFYLRVNTTCIEDEDIAEKLGLSYYEYEDLLKKFDAKKDNKNGYYYFYSYNKAKECKYYIDENILK